MDRKRIFEIGYISTFPVVMGLVALLINVLMWVGVYLFVAALVIAGFLIFISGRQPALPCEIEGCERDAVKFERFCRPCRTKLLLLTEDNDK